MTKTMEEVVAEWDAEQIRKHNELYYVEYRSLLTQEWLLSKIYDPYWWLLSEPKNAIMSDLDAAIKQAVDTSEFLKNLVRIRQLDKTLSLWESGKCIWSADE